MNEEYLKPQKPSYYVTPPHKCNLILYLPQLTYHTLSHSHPTSVNVSLMEFWKYVNSNLLAFNVLLVYIGL